MSNREEARKLVEKLRDAGTSTKTDLNTAKGETAETATASKDAAKILNEKGDNTEGRLQYWNTATSPEAHTVMPDRKPRSAPELPGEMFLSRGLTE